MKHKKLAILALVILLLSVGIVYALLESQIIRLPQTGKIVVVYPTPGGGGGPTPTPAVLKLAVYNDSACTVPLTAIDWGTMNNGSFYDKSMWLKNEGDVNCSVWISAENFAPSGSEFWWTLSFPELYQPFPVKVGEVQEVKMTLGILSNATESEFSWDMVITVEEA